MCVLDAMERLTIKPMRNNDIILQGINYDLYARYLEAIRYRDLTEILEKRKTNKLLILKTTYPTKP